MLQDIYPRKLNNQYDKDAVLSPQDTVVCISGGGFLINKSEYEKGNFVFPQACDFAEPVDAAYLFSIDDTRYFLNNSMENVTAPGFFYTSDRDIRTTKLQPEYQIFAALTAKHIYDWYRDTKFCGRCGAKMHHSETERAMKCSCGYTSYPRIMPAVIVGVLNKGKILITRYRTGYAHNALVAGFTEIGETVEETVAREVMEEAGIKVKNIRYYKSQPWGVANDILMGYFCEVDGDDTIKMDEGELKFAQWLTPEEMELQPNNFSLTGEMMRLFKEGKLAEIYPR